MTIRIRRISVVILSAVLVLAAVAKIVRPLVFPLPLDRCRSRQFDAVAWRDSTRVTWPDAVRGCMVDQLLSQHDFVRWTKDSVVAVLGPPTPTDYFRGLGLVYWLGPERGFMSIDSEWLVLTVNDDGLVTEAKVMTD